VTGNASEESFVSEPQFQPLRIRAILAEIPGEESLLNETERNLLFHDMLSPALLAWSSSLRVDPVVGNLTVDVHQLLDGETCGPGIDSGLPSIKVPLEHIHEGIPETDMIVYLSLGFAATPPNASNNETSIDDDVAASETNDSDDETDYSGNEAGSLEDRQDDSLFGGWFKDRGSRGTRRRLQSTEGSNRTSNAYNSSSPLPERGGRSGFLVDGSEETSEKNSTRNICTGEYLAAASYCSSDQFDRPTAALLHICIDDTFFDPSHRKRNILTLMHELGHALGFNSLSMAHFRRPDGTPYTPRDENGEIPETTIECTGPGTEQQFATVALPSEEILQFRDVRGGVRVAEIVTPSVLQVVRNQFDCQLLTGAELESGEGLPLSSTGDEGCIGDHWERRLFSSDLMNPVVDDLEYSTRISTLTLAYFADSGWYQVDLSNADVASGWGRGAGCNFVNDTCINQNGEVPPQNAPFFCNDISPEGLSSAENIHGCTPDLSRKATCSIGQYDLDLPPAYQYFNLTYGADVGGSDSLMDFCPVYMGYDNGLCSSTDGESVIKALDVERFGQRNSRCLVGNVRSSDRNTALCLPIACVIEDHSLRVKVDNLWHICERSNQKIVSESVIIECPDPRRVCPTFFCPYDCLGTGGVCDYRNGHCLCEYEKIVNGTEQKVFDVCGLVDEIQESEGSTLRPILRPGEAGKRDPAVPPPDTKLSDYYVADVRNLDDEPLMEAWAAALLGISGVLLVSVIVYVSSIRKSSMDDSSSVLAFLDCFKYFRKHTEESDHDPALTMNREKDKMVATVLVDMRIQNNELWRLRRGRELIESTAETEGRLTESEVESGPESMSDVSSRRSITMSDADTSQDEIEIDVSPPESGEEPQVVIRRRRIVPDTHTTSSMA
jgi:hypothetical protein